MYFYIIFIGNTIYEGTSGSTGISLSLIANTFNKKCKVIKYNVSIDFYFYFVDWLLLDLFT